VENAEFGKILRSNFTKHFGPPSDSKTKMRDAISRYLFTIFGYALDGATFGIEKISSLTIYFLVSIKFLLKKMLIWLKI